MFIMIILIIIVDIIITLKKCYYMCNLYCYDHNILFVWEISN